MPLELTQVDHIADLSRIELSDEERDRFREQLSKILEYFQILNDLDIETMSLSLDEMKRSKMYRMDKIVTGIDLENTLGNAPDVDQGQFRVPPVFK